MVKRIIRYVCEVCGSDFEEEKKAKDCEEQKIQPFKFEINDKAILKGTLFPETVEITGKFRSQEGHQNIYAVKKAVGWGESKGEQKSIVAEKDLIFLRDYEENMSELFDI